MSGLHAGTPGRQQFAQDAADPSPRQPGWTTRPDAEVVALSLRWAAVLLVLFVAVYGGLNWYAEQRDDRHRLWFDWELAAIPLVPWMILPYLSLFASFFLPMFALDAPRIRALCRRLLFATLVSGTVFLLLPADLGFRREAAVPEYGALFGALHALDLPHNLAPSLHVSWTLILLPALRAVSGPWVRAGLDLWAALLVASVLFTHQHHVLDVAGGMLVALAARAAVAPEGHWTILPRRNR